MRTRAELDTLAYIHVHKNRKFERLWRVPVSIHPTFFVFVRVQKRVVNHSVTIVWILREG